MKESTIIGPQGEPTPPSSLHPDNVSPTIPLIFTAPVTPLTPLQEANNHGDVLNKVANEHNIVCMFQKACDTDSALRKAISHIFGRNKMCTRLVPPEVWVHYCRKHYQRSRYRNPKEYAKLQCDLVQKQIRRIHDWSLFNQINGRPGVVQDWGLAVRKREQKRIDGLSGAKRKRSSSQYDDSEDDDDSPVPATAVPKWLRALCGKGYDTHSILRIFGRLHTEIFADLMPQFPDIEILPNIATELEEPQQPKGFVKRPVAVPGHKRSQSLGVGATPGLYSPTSGPIRTTEWGSADRLPMQKRQRRNDNIDAATERVTPTFGRHSLGSSRSSHSSVAENHSESVRMEDMRPHPNAYLPHLAAPTPQRHGGHSMAAHLETSSARRPVHHRSQSDVAGLLRGNDMYGGSQYTTSAHPSGMNSYGPSRFQQAPQNSFVINPSQPRAQPSKGSPQQSSMLSSKQLPSLKHPGRSGHYRHQSVPMAHFNRSPPGTSRDFSQGLPSINQSLSNGNTLPPVIQVTESVQAAAIFRERR